MTPGLNSAETMSTTDVVKRRVVKQWGSSAGFTLTELMIVVVIMGVLAAIGINSFRLQVNQSKSKEAVAMMESIAVAQEKFKTHHPTYLDVSAGDLTSYYPAANVGAIIRPFWGWDAHPDYDNWVRLDPKAPLEVRFAYATTAGLPYSAPTALTEGDIAGLAWPATDTIHNPWYVIQAIGDLNADGVNHLLITTSFTTKIYEEEYKEQ